ncbi:MAG TPA: nuclear transport factor 2 family protein [Candidatus Limnocylindrales bacterium]|nr:nuclear transport factor 2 family protein [Candidatus Limnocylindrales bacterium]
MNTPTATQPGSSAQTQGQAVAQVRRRLDEIWPAGAARDFERLESFHLYGPTFTMFKDGKPRGDAEACAAGERAFFGMLEQQSVEMNDLAINVVGDAAIATFNGRFSGRIAGNAVGVEQQVTMVFARVDDDWKIIHEHMSLIGGPSAGGPPPGAGGPPQR